MRRCLCLDHTCAPLGTGISGTHGDDDLIARGDVIQPLGPALADPDHVTASTGADDTVGFDHPLDAGQAFGQCAGLACFAGFLLFRIARTGRDFLFYLGNLRLRLSDGGFQIFQRQFQLGGVQLLGFRPEPA
jgi:hypothetical protein